MPVSATLELAEKYPNIHGLKDSTGTTEQASEIAAKAKNDFKIYSGDDHLLLPFLAVGATGIVSVASHIVGTQINNLMNAYFNGNLDAARQIYYHNLTLFKALFAAPNPTCVKYALAKLGLCKPHLRLPLVELTALQRTTLDTVLAGHNLDEIRSKTGARHLTNA